MWFIFLCMLLLVYVALCEFVSVCALSEPSFCLLDSDENPNYEDPSDLLSPFHLNLHVHIFFIVLHECLIKLNLWDSLSLANADIKRYLKKDALLW